MRVLFASDSFKGSLSSQETAVLLQEAFQEVYPDGSCCWVEMADGGEGTLEALQEVLHGTQRSVSIPGPDMMPAVCTYGLLPNKQALIEMAKCAGITMIHSEKRNPLLYGTYGMGRVIVDALDQGCRTLYICIGGSATMDGGMGCMSALGVRFLDADGNVLEGIAANLGEVKRIDCSNMDERLQETRVVVLCDVNNPLCGPDGAVYTFGAQKGADAQMQDALEKNMVHYAKVLEETFGCDAYHLKGGGAAGGMGAALSVFLHAQMESGIETVLKLVDFDHMLENVDLVVTGEGRTDWQSMNGKVVYGIGMHCKAKGIPVAALCGSLGQGYEDLYQCGIASFMTIQDGPMTLEECVRDAKRLYRNAAKRMFEIIALKIH